jgi:hypothetical protein
MRCKAAAHRTGASASWRISAHVMPPPAALPPTANTGGSLSRGRRDAGSATRCSPSACRHGKHGRRRWTSTSRRRHGRVGKLRCALTSSRRRESRRASRRASRRGFRTDASPRASIMPRGARVCQGAPGCGRDRLEGGRGQQALHRREPRAYLARLRWRWQLESGARAGGLGVALRRLWAGH